MIRSSLIAEQNGFAKNRSIELVENLIEIIKRALESGEDVLIRGFGKFRVKKKGKRHVAIRPADLI